MVLLCRFRSAREAVECEKKARDRGEVLPSEERFDSNCITPGTEFMVRLDAQLQYFVTCKISQDKMWQNCKVIYSGHQVWRISRNLSFVYILLSCISGNFRKMTYVFNLYLYFDSLDVCKCKILHVYANINFQ